MTDHENEGILDKIKDALGMGADDEHATTDADRPEGWAGVDDALGGTENRPAGPDYADDDRTVDPVQAGEEWTGGVSRGGSQPYDTNTDLDVDPEVAGSTRREEDL